MTSQSSQAPRRARLSRSEKRALILKTAEDLFLRDGFSGMRMDELHAMVGGSKQTLYSHFPTKADLYLAVIEELIADAISSLEAVGPAQSSSLEEGLIRLATRLNEILFAPRIVRLQLISFWASTSGDVQTENSKRFYDGGFQRCVDVIAALLQSHAQTPANVQGREVRAAEYFMSLICFRPMLRTFSGMDTYGEDFAGPNQPAAFAKETVRDFLTMIAAL